MPGDHAFRLALLDFPEHLVEDGSPRRLGAHGLFIDPHDRDAVRGGVALHLRALRVDREDLAVLGLARLPAVKEVVHLWVSTSRSTRADASAALGRRASVRKSSSRRAMCRRASSLLTASANSSRQLS